MMTYGSLFAGIGGVDIGFDRAGFSCQWQVEQDKHALKVLDKHWPNVPKFNDVRKFNPTERVDIVCGGFPCQDVSNAANNRHGLRGARSGLWGEMLRIIERTEPAVVFIENVSVLRSRGLFEVLRNLAALGYDAEWATVCASQYGFAHRRARLFIVAYTDRLDGIDRSDNERFSGVGVGCQVNAAARACGDGGDVLRWLVETYKAFDKSPHIAGTGRSIDGRADWLDRLRGLGNAVVPDIAEDIAHRIRRGLAI